MKINTLLDKAKKYVLSFFYPLSLAILTFFIWFSPTSISYVLAIIYGLLSFLPLLTENGKSYLALLLFPIVAQNENISTSSIAPYIIIMIGSTIVSIVIYIIIHKLEFRKGDMMVPLLMLIGSFFISFFYNAIKNQFLDTSSLLFLFFMLIECLSYSLLCTTIGREDSFPFLCKAICLFSVVISLEILTFCIKNGFTFGPKNFNLGWAYTIQSASSLLCMTLPFYGILIYFKKWQWIIPELLVIASIFILSTDSALLCLLFAFIPLILLSFRSYGKLYSYISLAMIIAIGTTTVLFILFNQRFSDRLLQALSSLNLLHEEGSRKTLFQEAVDSFLTNPYVGTSISSFSNGNNTLTFASNTILSVMVAGGSLSLICYLLYEVKLYVITFRKKTHNKWIYLVFLLLFEMIGLIDNTMFNLGILELFLISQATYEMSNRPEDVIVHNEFYRNYKKKPNSLT